LPQHCRITQGPAFPVARFSLATAGPFARCLGISPSRPGKEAAKPSWRGASRDIVRLVQSCSGAPRSIRAGPVLTCARFARKAQAPANFPSVRFPEWPQNQFSRTCGKAPGLTEWGARARPARPTRIAWQSRLAGGRTSTVDRCDAPRFPRQTGNVPYLERPSLRLASVLFSSS